MPDLPLENVMSNHPAVLVVDDEPLIRWSIAETLRHRGYAVVVAGDADAARGAVANATTPFSAIVLDVRLPDVHDLSFLSELCESAVTTPVILMTAHGTPELERDALSLGARAVMHKPFGMADIAAAVDAARAA